MGWLYYSNLHISIVAAGIVLGSYALADEKAVLPYIILAASGALLVYHADRAFFKSREDIENAPDRLAWYDLHRPYLVLSTIVGVLGVVYGATSLPAPILLGGAVLGVVGLLYAAPLPYMSKRLKDLPVFKTLLILFCWVAGALVLPLYDTVLSSTLLMLALYRSLYILPNLILAEWVDTLGDARAGVSSTGSMLSLGGVRTTAGISFLMAIAFSLILMQSGLQPILLGIDLIGMAGCVLMIFAVSEWQTKHVVWLDILVGFPAITWLIYFLF